MQPKVKKYLNVFQYLQDVYQFRKNRNATFSYDIWSRELGASDKSYVRLMVIGKRPINQKMALAFCLNLGLGKEDADYFCALVEYTQCRTRESKDLFGKKLISLLKHEEDRLEITSHYEFLSDPILPRLQILLSLSDIDISPDNLGFILGITSAEATAALEKLQNLKLIEKKEDKFVPLKRSFNVPDNFNDLGLDAFYRENLQNAQKAIALPKEERRFKSLFLPLNAAEFNSFMDSLQIFVNELLFKYNPDEFADRRLFQVHMNIFPVSAAAKKWRLPTRSQE